MISSSTGCSRAPVSLMRLDDLRRQQLRRRRRRPSIVLGAIGAVRVLQQRAEVALEHRVGLRPGARRSAAGRSSGCAAGGPGRRSPGRGARWPARAGRARRGTRRRPCRRARRRAAGAARGSPSRRRGRGRRAPGRRTGGSSLLERGRAVQAVDAVVRERALSRSTKRSGSRSALASSERRNACRYSCGLCSSSRSGSSCRARLKRAHVG